MMTSTVQESNLPVQTDSNRAWKVGIPVALLAVLTGGIAFAGPRIGIHRAFSLIPGGLGALLLARGISLSAVEIRDQLEADREVEQLKAILEELRGGNLPTDPEKREIAKSALNGELTLRGPIVNHHGVAVKGADARALHFASIGEKGDWFGYPVSILTEFWTDEFAAPRVSREGVVGLFKELGWTLPDEGGPIDARVVYEATIEIGNPVRNLALYRWLKSDDALPDRVQLSQQAIDLLLTGEPIESPARAEHIKEELALLRLLPRDRDRQSVWTSKMSVEIRRVDPKLWVNHLVFLKQLCEMGLLHDRLKEEVDLVRKDELDEFIDGCILAEGFDPKTVQLTDGWATVLLPDVEVQGEPDLETICLARIVFLEDKAQQIPGLTSEEISKGMSLLS